MTKKTFIILLTIEVFLAMIAMGLMLSDLGAYCYLVAAVLFTVVLTPFFIKLKKTEDEAKKNIIRRNILLVMLLPIAIALVLFVLVVIALALAIG